MSVDIEVEIPKLPKMISNLSQFDQIATKHLVSGMDFSLLTVRGEVKKNTPIGVSSRLRGSIASEITQTVGSTVIGKVGTSLKEPYPSVINFGRTPGWFPPPEALERWVQLKLRVPAKRVKGVAFAVARKISRTGIKGRRFMEKGFQAAKSRVNANFNRARDRIIKELISG